MIIITFGVDGPIARQFFSKKSTVMLAVLNAKRDEKCCLIEVHQYESLVYSQSRNGDDWRILERKAWRDDVENPSYKAQPQTQLRAKTMTSLRRGSVAKELLRPVPIVPKAVKKKQRRELCDIDLWELRSLLKLLKNASQLYTHIGRTVELDPFEVQLPGDMGNLKAKPAGTNVILMHRKRFGTYDPQSDVAAIDSRGTVQFTGAAQNNPLLAAAIRDVLGRLLWNFIADRGQRFRCIFCNAELTHESSKSLGYGPVCARKKGLYWRDS